MAYVVVWEFKVRPRMRKRFEKSYGSHGPWVRLFRQNAAFIRTEVIQDVQDGSRYLTVDFWKSEAAYEAFRKKRKEDYQRIDAVCEQMTEAEREVGRFRLR
jgi:heme-degrading monooxygenase HmoA